MEKTIRRARMEDAQAIRAIDGEMGGVMGLEITLRPVEYYEDWLHFHRACKRYPAFVGTEDGEVVWWVALGEYPGGYPFDGVAVVEMGIPERKAATDLTDLLLRFLEQQAIRLGHYKLIAYLDAEQRYLLHTYRRVGFRDVGTLRCHGYRKGKLVDLVIMERLLTTDMEALEEYYSKSYHFYRDYFDKRHKLEAAEAPVEEDLTGQYEEVAIPEDQLPEGIVRFLRTKKAPDDAPSDPDAASDSGPDTDPASDAEPSTDEPDADPVPISDQEPAPVPAKAPSGPQLPEGIIRFLKSKKRPDGTPANPELPPIVPVKLSPAQRHWAEAALADEERQQTLDQLPLPEDDPDDDI